MNLKDIILKRRIIEIELFGGTVFYSGVCLKANDSFWLIVNYDIDKGIFDGFTVLRNEDVDSYSVYIKKTLLLKKENFLSDHIKLLPDLNEINSFQSCLISIFSFKIIAYFLEKNIDSYYVGLLKQVKENKLYIQTIYTDFTLGKMKIIQIKKIHFFSFETYYEKKIKYNLTTNQ
jgi:hypothetical protein